MVNIFISNSPPSLQTNENNHDHDIIINRYETSTECLNTTDSNIIYSSFMEIVTRKCSTGYSFTCDDIPYSNTSALKLHTYDYKNCSCSDSESNSRCDVKIVEEIDNSCIDPPSYRYPYDVRLFNMEKALDGFFTLTCDFNQILKRVVVLRSTLVILPSSSLTIDDFGNYTHDCNNYCETITSSLSTFYRIITRNNFPSTSDIFIINVSKSNLVNVRDDDPLVSSNITVFRILYTVSSTNPTIVKNISNGGRLSTAQTCADTNFLDCATTITMEDVIKQQARNLSAFNLYDMTIWIQPEIGDDIRSTKIYSQAWFVATIVLITSLLVIIILLSLWFIRRKLKRNKALANMKNYTDSANIMRRGSHSGDENTEAVGESKEIQFN